VILLALAEYLTDAVYSSTETRTSSVSGIVLVMAAIIPTSFAQILTDRDPGLGCFVTI
jgi:hypothetical protein